MEQFNLDGYVIVEENIGHKIFNKKGYKNPYTIFEKNGDKKVLVKVNSTQIEHEIKFLIDYDSLEKISKTPTNKDITWYYSGCGYIQGMINKKPKFLHHLLMDFESKGKGFQDSSVDHIDRNPMNNSMANLRIATMEEQQSNTKGGVDCPGTKRARKKKC